MNWKFGYLIGILSLYVTVHAAPVSQDADGYRPVEIRTIEVVKTVTKTEGTCAHTTGLGAGYSKGLQTPSTIATTVLAAEQTSATITNPPAATSLNAAVHWDVDLQRVENLQANKTVDMFYCEHEIERRDGKAIPPSNNTAVGFLKVANMQYPSVQLEHTSYISSVDCSNSTIQVKFNNKKAFSVAHTDWSSHKSGFLLITIDPNCRLSTEEMQRGYILVKSVTAHNSTMTVTGNSEPVSFADAVGRETPIDFSFGNFQTNSTDGFNVPATGPPARINATGVSSPSSPSNGTRDPSGDSSFDEDLDRLIGVMSSEEFQTQMLGRYNVSLEDLAGDDDIPDILPGAGFRKRHLVRRGLFSSIKKGLKKIGNAVKDTVDKVGDVVKKVTGTVGDVIDKGIDTLGKWLSITKSFNKDFSFDTKKNQNTKQTPWGPGVELFSKSTPGGSGSAAVYCVDCGATGKMVLQGKVTFSVIKGLEEGYISADGNLHAGLQLGIVASYKDHWGFDKEIVTIPLTPYTIPGIITLGPSVSLSAGAQVEILAEGQLLAGFTADVLNFTARFDLKDKDKSVMPNFGPDAKPVFEGKAKIVLSAEAFLALKLAVGVKILSGVFDKSVGIVEKPKLFLKAGVDASFSRDGGGQFSDPNCKGLNIELGFGNELSLDLFGSKKTLSDIKGSIWDHCIVLQKDSTIQSPQNSASQIAPPSSIIQIAPASSSIQIAPPSSSAQTVPQSSPLVPNPPHGNTTVQTSPSSNTTVQASPNSNATVQISPNVNSTIGNLPPNTTAPIVKGSKFSRIKTWSGSLNLHYSRNANIYAVPPQNVEDPSDASGFFTADPSGDFVIGDSHGRYLHGYKTEIDGYGVGRLRLHAADAMPKTASLLSFASTTIDATGESLLVLADLAGAVYFPIVCLYEASIFPKIFLAKDPVNGVTQLEDAKLEGLITGNKVKNCGYLPMKYDA